MLVHNIGNIEYFSKLMKSMENSPDIIVGDAFNHAANAGISINQILGCMIIIISP